jgi:2-(1,2-epoxy-1,2-dihydrophenyl)acetyl-CoA isomerase
MYNTQHPVLIVQHGATVVLTLNRPEVLNAIDGAMVAALQSALANAAQAPGVRAVILTGSGRGFCAGGDLRFALDANPDRPGDSFTALTDVLHPCIELIRTMDKPVIAAINGPAAGAGLFLALACDLRVMASNTYLKQSNTSYGLSLPAGGTFLLPRLVGMGQALEIVLLDEPIPAHRALELGLVNQVAPAVELFERARALAARAAQMPVETLGRVKRLLNQALVTPLADQLAHEQVELAASANSSEGREGIVAFLEKRRPDFRAAACPCASVVLSHPIDGRQDIGYRKRTNDETKTLNPKYKPGATNA